MDERSAPQRASWLDGVSTDVLAVRRGRRWLWVCLCVYAAVLWFALTPHAVGSSWRECDTMAIARNFVVDGFNPLRPCVDWRGQTDGAVECEFPFYQSLIAATLVLFGEIEWPARLLSLLAMVFAGLSLHRLLELRSGPAGAIAGTVVFLFGAQAVMLGARVQPDGLSTALALAGTVTFLRYLATGSGTALWLAVAATTLGVLQKPTALQVVAVQGLWTVFLAPARLRDRRLWIGFAIVLGVLAAWLWQGTRLYGETGLTFGVVGGGETKFPALDHLLVRWVWRSLIQTTIDIGLSPLGCLALLAVVLRWRLDRCDFALLAAVGAGLVGSMRYSHTAGTGPHYHVFAAIAGAFFVARAWPKDAPRWLWAALLAAVAVCGRHWIEQEQAKLAQCNQPGFFDLAAAVNANFGPDELGVVRGPRDFYDSFWRRRTNYEYPALFYQSRRRGWMLPRDGFDIEHLQDVHALGASFVVDTSPALTSPEVNEWLEENGDRLVTHVGVVHRLHPLARTH